MTGGMAPFEIRRLEAGDAEAFSALRRAVTTQDPVGMGLSLEDELARPLERFREQLSAPAPSAVFGAFVAGELVATAAVSRAGAFASIAHKMLMWGVFTRPPFRRRGLGRAVVQAALAHASASGARRVNLLVYVPNEPALALYRSLGFVECGVEPEAIRLQEQGHDGVHMTLAMERGDAPRPPDPASAGSAGAPAGRSSGTARVQPSLTTARLVLRPFVREDAGEVQRLAGDARVAAGTLLPHPYPDGLAQTWIDGHRAAFEARREVAYAVTQRDGGRLVGAVSLLSMSQAHARAEVGFWIGPEHWGQGYCTEAVRELMAFGAESLGITRFVGRCVDWNAASAAVMVKAGMSPEGRWPKHEFRGGRYVDQLMFGCVLPGRGDAPSTDGAPSRDARRDRAE